MVCRIGYAAGLSALEPLLDTEQWKNKCVAVSSGSGEPISQYVTEKGTPADTVKALPVLVASKHLLLHAQWAFS